MDTVYGKSDILIALAAIDFEHILGLHLPVENKNYPLSWIFYILYYQKPCRNAMNVGRREKK